MRRVALAVVVLALVSATIATAGSAPPPPTVWIASPENGAATGTDVLAVDVAFAAAPIAGKVHTLVLELDGREIARRTRREHARSGSHRFTIDLASVAEGVHVVRALAFQGHARGAVPGVSAPVELTIIRAPELEGGLEGPPGRPALEAVDDVFSPAAYVTPGELSGATVRTQVELVFARDASVGDVNALLRSIDGRIVSQREGALIAVVRIPDPGSLEALDALLASLDASPALRAANPVAMAATAELPAIVDAGTGEVELLRHQLAVKAHAAWNARAALNSVTPPTFVLGDSFGDGAPGDLFGLNVRDEDYAEGRAQNGHGYHVLGIAATAFDPLGGAFFADAVTGMYPGALDVRAVDQLLGLAGATTQDRLLEEVEDAPGQVVVNTSLQTPCENAADAARYCTGDGARDRGLAWIERVRGSDPAHSLEGKFVHLTAAGNRAPGVDPIDASVGGWDAANAALYPIFVGGGPLERVPNLTNTLVVENLASAAPEPFAPGCRSTSSDAGGTIAAIGEAVHSFVSPATAGELSGTSMATPQAAGLAAYVWALRPGLSPGELIALLQRTGTAADASCGPTPPVIDAYAAVLAADEGNAARPVRLAILDAADHAGEPGENGRFDESDVALHFDELAAGAGAIDYGRHDLNGDGRTGGDAVARLDLDADGAYGSVTLDVDGLPVRFDENAATDLKALCHAAYSPLYAGDPLARSGLLGHRDCLRLDLGTLFPSIVAPGVSNTLTVSLLDLDLPVGNRGQAGVRIELTPTGGAVGAFAGTTNAQGIFQTTATLFAGRSELTIDVVARAGESGEVLARTTVRATGGAVAPNLLGTWSGVAFCDPVQAFVLKVISDSSDPRPYATLTPSVRGVILGGAFFLEPRPDGTYRGTDEVFGTTLDLVPDPTRPDWMSGSVTGDGGRCSSYEIFLQLVSR